VIKFDSNPHSLNKIECLFCNEQHCEGYSKNTDNFRSPLTHSYKNG